MKNSYICAGMRYGPAASQASRPAAMDRLLRQMDRLGITAAVVSHAAAEEQNPTLGNRKLLEDISRENAQDRIFPCFGVTRETRFRNGETEFIKEHLQSGRVRCLWLCRDGSEDLPGDFRQILSETVAFAPLLLIDAQNAGPDVYRQMSALAGVFRKQPLVILGTKDAGYISLFDLMREHDNVYADVSFLEFRGALDGLAEAFGAHRLLLSAHTGSHFGATHTALNGSQLSPRQRRMVAAHTLLTLLGVNTQEHADADDNGDPPAGLPAELRISDAFCPVGPLPRGLSRETELSAQLAVLAAERRIFNGLKMTVSTEAVFGECIAGNRNLEIQAKPMDGFKGYFVYNPHQAADLRPDVLFDFFHRGFFTGLALAPDAWQLHIHSPAYAPAFEFAHRHRLPVVLWRNTGKYCPLSDVQALADAYPLASLVLHGIACGEFAAACEALGQSDTIYISTGSLCTDGDLHGALQSAPAGKLLFSSGGYEFDPYRRAGVLLHPSLAEEEVIKVFGTSLDKLLERKTRR